MMRPIVLFLTLSVLLAACATKEPKVRTVTQTRVVKPQVNQPARPRPVTMRDVEFYVVTEENFEEFKERFTRENSEFVFVAISVDDYEDLSLNLADIRRYIAQQKEIIVFYERAVK